MATRWAVEPLHALAADEPNAITDGPFGSKLKSQHYTSEGPRVIRLQNIGDSVFKDANAHISRDHFRTLLKHRIYSGDLVIAALGENPPRSCIIPDFVGDAIVKADCIRFRPGGRIIPTFLNYVLNSPPLRLFAKQIIHGVGRPRLNLGEIKSLPIPVPPFEEQQRVVAEIERQFTRLDAGVAGLERVQANLKRYRAAVLKAACEGTLVPTEAALARAEGRNYETGEQLLERILTARRETWAGKGKYKTPASPDTAGLPPLPEGWTWATIEQVVSLVTTGATPLRSNGAFWLDGTIPWVTSGALNRPFIDHADELITDHAVEQTNAKVFAPGTLLVALYGEGKTRGKASELRIAAATNQACAALLFDRHSDLVRPYLKVFLMRNYHDVRTLSSGGVQPNLSVSLIRGMSFPLPPLAEQHRIVAEVERRLSVIDELETLVETNLARAGRLRQSILAKAFSGELVPEEAC